MAAHLRVAPIVTVSEIAVECKRVTPHGLGLSATTAQGDWGLLILEIDIAVEHVDRKSSPDSVPEERLAIGGPVLFLGSGASFPSSVPGSRTGVRGVLCLCAHERGCVGSSSLSGTIQRRLHGESDGCVRSYHG
jgi:hypothetical protein